MNNDTNRSALPSLIGGVLADQKHYIDNLFADTWKTLRFSSLLNLETAVGSRKYAQALNASGKFE